MKDKLHDKFTLLVIFWIFQMIIISIISSKHLYKTIKKEKLLKLLLKKEKSLHRINLT